MPIHSVRSGRLRALFAAALILIVSAFPAPAAASDDESNPDAVGHSADGYYFDLMVGHKIIELPRLLLVRGADGGLRFDAFGSTHSALEHGDYTLLDVEGHPMHAEEVHELMEAGHRHLYYKLVPAAGSMVIDFSITRQILFVFISALVLLIIAFRLAARYRAGYGVTQAPKGRWQNMMEVLILFIRDEIAKPAIGAHYAKYTSYLTTAFFFILLGNLLGLVPWGVTATSNIMVTGTLAFFTFIITQFSGSKDYWKHILWPPGVPVAIKFILIPIEIIGIFTKPIALAFRLFGNMISGHIAIVSLLGLIFIFAPIVNQIESMWLSGPLNAIIIVFSMALTIFIYVLKILVSFIQAYIFTMLSAVFIGMAREEHHHDDEYASESASAGSLAHAAH
ncbi:MAG: F0F1 ATP synthase subunit A [Rhodothermales bacterium]